MVDLRDRMQDPSWLMVIGVPGSAPASISTRAAAKNGVREVQRCRSCSREWKRPPPAGEMLMWIGVSFGWGVAENGRSEFPGETGRAKPACWVNLGHGSWLRRPGYLGCDVAGQRFITRSIKLLRAPALIGVSLPRWRP